MEQKRWSNIFFIKAIKGNLVKKIRNVEVYRKQALKFKTVKEILDAQDAKKLPPSTSQAAQFKTESYYLPHAERCLEKFDPRETESVHCAANDESGNDLDNGYGEITLKQLKERFKTKKRKLINVIDVKKLPKLEPEEDDSDLREPLSSLRLKFIKAKKKHAQATVESEEYTHHEMQLHKDLALISHVKIEVPDPVIIECELKIPSIDDCPNIDQGAESSIAGSITDITQKTLDCQSSESLLFTEQYPSCSLNEEVSYDHLQHVDPNSLSIPTCEDTMDVDGQEESCQEYPDLPASECEIETSEQPPLLITLPTKDENLYINSFSRSTSHTDAFLEQESGHEAVLASNLEVDDCVSIKDPYHGNESLTFSDDTKKDLGSNQQIDDTSSPACKFSTYWEHHLCLSPNDNLLCVGTEQQQPLSCSSPDGGKSPAKPRNHFSSEGKSSLDEHEENKTSIHVGDEKQERYSSPKNQSCNIDETLLTPVLVQPPERLLLTRKVISPSSEERLCLAMNSAESYIEENSKENPRPSPCNQNENKASSVGSEVKHANKIGNPTGLGITNRTKVIIKPARPAKRSKNSRRHSPPKGNLEGPRLCRSLPNVSTGCTSLQGCSESAIAFSQRQMHDIESLAVKLVSELKYMKEIVEEKLLFEGYRNASIKNDADEVKDAITNAVKVEETARKWLSMMSRDCNRFCKIMSLTQNGTDPATSKNGIQRERRKITFADEAGGILCHVKVFGNEMPLESDGEK